MSSHDRNATSGETDNTTDPAESHTGADGARVSGADTFAQGADPFDAGATTLVEQRVEDFIATSQLVPSVDWIMMNVVAKGKGTKRALARLVGVATGSATQMNSIAGKDPIESIKLTGDFEATLYETGEVITAGAAYLPKMWGRQVHTAITVALTDDPQCRPAVQMILSLGVEATGKPIPYRWTVSTYLPRPVSPQLANLKTLVAQADRNAAKQLTLDGMVSGNAD